MSGSHNHNHSHSIVSGKNLLLSIVLNILITVSQVIGGLLSGSLSLLSDALHNFSDVISLVVSYFANRIARRKASINKTFGFKRAEIMAAFINSATLVIVAILLIFEVVERFQNPQKIESLLVIILSSVAILGNGFSVLLLRKEKNHNMNMKSAYLHLITDMMASVAVLIGGLLMKYYQIYIIDSILTLAIAIYLIYVGYDLLKSSFKMLMLFTPDNVAIDELAERINKMPEVNSIHHIHVWQLNETETHLEAHIDFNKDITVSEFGLILIKIEKLLHQEYEINHVTLQPEYDKKDDKNIIVQD
ncbi:MAG: cation transporter [Aquimarina sp.]|nr:cation transporter [Aquimarina sp.]|tara:strand:- start:37 stop:948 length:912 start_codon:yes stop_codon:yes gene_type:complete